MNIDEKIIDYLIRNRVSTTEVADALGKTGVIEDVMPVNRGYYKVGKIKWIYAYDNSNWAVHEQIQEIEDERVVFVDAFDCGNRAIFGELVSKYLLLYRRSQAIVVVGKMRDAAALIRENWPIWCKGFNPVGCFNKQPQKKPNEIEINMRKKQIDDGIAICDDCGVVIIQPDQINEELLLAIKEIENQEDIWFDRLDHYKESTFDIVCKKKYMHDEKYVFKR